MRRDGECVHEDCAWHVGDEVARQDPDTGGIRYRGVVVGWCVGEDGRDCLVCRQGDGSSAKRGGVYLLPVEEARRRVGPEQLVREILLELSRDGLLAYTPASAGEDGLRRAILGLVEKVKSMEVAS